MPQVEKLNLLEVEGKTYLRAAKWPEAIQVERAAIKAFDPRRTAWDGQNFKVWLENGNAVYTLAPGDDGKGDVLTLHRKVSSDPGPVPGYDTDEPIAPTPALTSEAVKEAPERPRIVVPDEAVGIFNPRAGELMGSASSGYAMQQLIAQAQSGVDPLTRAILGATDPRQARTTGPNANLSLGMYGPRPDTLYGMPVYANQYVNLPDPIGTPTPPTTPDELRREMQAAQRRLMAEMELKLAQLATPPVYLQGPATVPLAVSVDAAAQQWRKFLVNAGAFFKTFSQVIDVLPGPSDREVWITDPLSLQGMAYDTDTAGMWETTPRTMKADVICANLQMAADRLAKEASRLSKDIAPVAPVDEGKRIRNDVDAGVQLEVTRIEGDIVREYFPNSILSDHQIRENRVVAWSKWAEQNCDACDEDEPSYADTMAELVPGQMMRTPDGILHHRLKADVTMNAGDVLRLEYKITGVHDGADRGEVTSRTRDVESLSDIWGVSAAYSGHDHTSGGNGEMGAEE